MKTRTADHNDHLKTWQWLEEFVASPHENLGRTGNVCPFVKPAMDANSLLMETAIYDEHSTTLADLCQLMQQQIDKFPDLTFPEGKDSIATLVTVIDGMPENHWLLLDEAQRRVKAYAVKHGFMLGQFHPNCAEPAVLNPAFPVSRSPEPLFAIRRIAQHDILFLHASPAMFAEYKQRFGELYNRPDHPMPKNYVRLYKMAENRGSGRSSYIDYQSIDVLLSLQHPNTDHPAEMSFYISGQVKELLFKLMFEQARTIRLELAGDHLDEAIWGLRRLTAALDVLTRMWDLLATLAPTEFNTFREQLTDASGTGSYMFRMVEFSLGRKLENLAERFKDIPGIGEDVYRAYYDSSVYDEALFVLVRHGLLAKEAVSIEAKDSTAITEVWAEIYRQSGPSNPLFRLAEALMDVAEGFGRWRSLHLLTVERMIGSKTGTGGTDGIAWLRRSAAHRFFPELWDARTLLPSAAAPF